MFAFIQANIFFFKIKQDFNSRGVFQDGGRVAIHEAKLNSVSKPIYSVITAKIMKIITFDFNTNANSVITIF